MLTRNLVNGLRSLNALGWTRQNGANLVGSRSIGVCLRAAYSMRPDAVEGELDDLYKRIVVEVRGHDRAVLDSYANFVKMTSNELECNLSEIREPHRFIERWTVLKSRFSNRKHMRQYEMRTYFREFEFKHLTGSTCDTLLEYIQRNLPEGVAMHVHKTKINPLPEHFTQSN